MLPLTLTSQKQSPPAAQVHRAEDDTTRVPARKEHPRWLAASAPIGAQRREPQQIGLVFHQQGATSRQLPDSAADTAFFSRVPDRAPAHTWAVSKRNPDGSIRGESCDRRISCPGTFAKGRAAAGRSSSPPCSRVLLASDSGSFATTPSILRSKPEVVLHAQHNRPRQRCKQILGRTGQQQHRHKDDADGQRGNECRRRCLICGSADKPS